MDYHPGYRQVTSLATRERRWVHSRYDGRAQQTLRVTRAPPESGWLIQAGSKTQWHMLAFLRFSLGNPHEAWSKYQEVLGSCGKDIGTPPQFPKNKGTHYLSHVHHVAPMSPVGKPATPAPGALFGDASASTSCIAATPGLRTIRISTSRLVAPEGRGNIILGQKLPTSLVVLLPS